AVHVAAEAFGAIAGVGRAAAGGAAGLQGLRRELRMPRGLGLVALELLGNRGWLHGRRLLRLQLRSRLLGDDAGDVDGAGQRIEDAHAGIPRRGWPSVGSRAAA